MLLGEGKISKKPTFIFAFLHALYCFVPLLYATARKSFRTSLAKHVQHAVLTPTKRYQTNVFDVK